VRQSQSLGEEVHRRPGLADKTAVGVESGSVLRPCSGISATDQASTQPPEPGAEDGVASVAVAVGVGEVRQQEQQEHARPQRHLC